MYIKFLRKCSKSLSLLNLSGSVSNILGIILNFSGSVLLKITKIIYIDSISVLNLSGNLSNHSANVLHLSVSRGSVVNRSVCVFNLLNSIKSPRECRGLCGVGVKALVFNL